MRQPAGRFRVAREGEWVLEGIAIDCTSQGGGQKLG